MRNKIVVPATVLLPPLFAPGAPASLTYGGLGAVLGHEMTHAFDVEGSEWDAHGNYRNWWSPESRQEYAARMACLRDSHGLSENKQQDGENTADFSGLVSAFKAYSGLDDTEQLEGLDYNAEQLFFIASCIKWCATNRTKQGPLYASFPKRCNVPLKNIAGFARAFKCPAGSPMNPSSRCTFW